MRRNIGRLGFQRVQEQTGHSRAVSRFSSRIQHCLGGFPGLLINPAQQQAKTFLPGCHQPRHHAIPLDDPCSRAAGESDPFGGRGEYQPDQGEVVEVVMLQVILRHGFQQTSSLILIERVQPGSCEERMVGYGVAVVLPGAERCG